MLFTSECFVSPLVEKYTVFTFVFFKSKHDISLSIIKKITDFKRLNTNKKNIFHSNGLSQQAKKKTSRVKIQFEGVMFGSLCCCNLERDSKVRAYIINYQKQV